MVSVIASLAGRFILAPLASLWRWLTDDPTRMAFAVVIGLCSFLAWRLSSVDGDRDKWRDKARAMIAAAKELERADAKADTAGSAKAGEVRKGIDDGNKRAADAARDSDDPLKSGFDSLRQSGGSKGD